MASSRSPEARPALHPQSRSPSYSRSRSRSHPSDRGRGRDGSDLSNDAAARPVLDQHAPLRDSRSPSQSPSRSRSRSHSQSPPRANGHRRHDRSDSRSLTPRRDSRSRSRSFSRSPRRRSQSRRMDNHAAVDRRRGSLSPRSSSPPMQVSSKIVVEKLTKNVTEHHLQEIFGIYGRIREIDLPMNRTFLTNRGTAYIIYEAVEGAETAIAHMHEAQLDGAVINVSIVLPRRKFSRSPPPSRRLTAHQENYDGYGPPGGSFRGGPRSGPGAGPPPRPGSRGYRSPSPARRSPPIHPSRRFNGMRGGRGGGGPPDRRGREYRDGNWRRNNSYSRSRSRSRSPRRSRSRSYSSRSPSRSPPPRRTGGGGDGTGNGYRRRDSPPPRRGPSGGHADRSRRSPSYSSYSSYSDRSRSRSRDRDRRGRR